MSSAPGGGADERRSRGRIIEGEMVMNKADVVRV